SREADLLGQLRGDLSWRTRNGCRSGEQHRFLAERRGPALLEPGAENARHRVGAADRRSDGAPGVGHERRRAEADVRRGPEDLRRASTGRVFRGATRVRRDVVARDQPDAGARPAAGAVVSGHGAGSLMARYLARRLVFAALLVFVVSSASLI